MKCKCGYSGEPEYGVFDATIPWSVDTNKVHVRCPKCKENEHIIIEAHERVRLAILYPEYCPGGHSNIGGFMHPVQRMTVHIGERGDYSITCPECGWGEGGRLSEDKAEELRKLLSGGEE